MDYFGTLDLPLGFYGNIPTPFDNSMSYLEMVAALQYAVNAVGKQQNSIITELSKRQVLNDRPATNFLLIGGDSTGEIDNSALFTGAAVANSRIFLPAGTFKITAEISAQNVEIYGVRPYWDGVKLTGGTIIQGKLTVTGSNISIHDIGVAGDGDGISIKNNAKYINVKNVITDVDVHGFIAEQFGGGLNTVIFEDCESRGGIHGFVSKAENVRFFKCRAYGATTSGFIVTSDNLTGAAVKSNANNNSVTHCYAESCGNGMSVYVWDLFSENNANGLELKNLVISNNIFKSCTNFGIGVGTGSNPIAGKTLVNAENISIIGNVMKGCVASALYIDRCTKAAINGNSADTACNKSANVSEIKIGVNNFVGGGNLTGYVIDVYNAVETVVDWGKGETHVVALTGDTAKITFTGASVDVSKPLTILLSGDAVRNITTWSANIKWATKPAATVSGKDIVMQFIYDGTAYQQLSYVEKLQTV